MRTFSHGNWSGKNRVCPICKTNKKGEVVLIAIDGGNSPESPLTYKAIQVHLDCINLWYNRKTKLIYQQIQGEVEDVL